MLTRIRHILAASYPELWPYTGFLFLFGTLSALKEGVPLPFSFLPYWLWFFAGANIFGMLLNDFYDRKLDADNPRKNRLRLTFPEYWWGIAISLLAFVLLEALWPEIGVLWWVVVAIVINVAYSAPPLRLKTLPPFDLLGGPGSYLTAILAGYALVRDAWPSLSVSIAGCLFFVALDLAFKSLDIEADRRGGIRTSATILGRRGSALAASRVLGGAAVFLSLGHPLYAFAVLPYLGVTALIQGATTDAKRSRVNRLLPYVYVASGVAVTVAFYLLA